MLMHNRQVANGTEQGAGGVILNTVQLPVLRAFYSQYEKWPAWHLACITGGYNGCKDFINRVIHRFGCDNFAL